MRFIGESIRDAIDWTQDKIHGTRPQAETVLFDLMAEKKVTETEDGFILLEDNDDELVRKAPRRRARFRFHHTRKTIHQANQAKKNAVIQHGDNSTAADTMLDDDEDPN